MDIKAVERKWQSFWEKSKNIGYDPEFLGETAHTV